MSGDIIPNNMIYVKPIASYKKCLLVFTLRQLAYVYPALGAGVFKQLVQTELNCAV